MSNIDCFTQFTKNFDKNVCMDVLTINYKTYLAEQYLQHLGVNMKKFVEYLLDPNYIMINTETFGKLKNSFNLLIEKCMYIELKNDQRFTSCINLLQTIEKDGAIKVKDFEVLLILYNSLYNTINLQQSFETDNLSSTSCPFIQQILTLDGFFYTNKHLILQMNKQENSSYITLLQKLYTLILPSENFRLFIINEIIVKFLKENLQVKKDADFCSLLDDWDKRPEKTKVDPELYTVHLKSLLESKEKSFLLFISPFDVKKLKDIKRSLKIWSLKEQNIHEVL